MLVMLLEWEVSQSLSDTAISPDVALGLEFYLDTKFAPQADVRWPLINTIIISAGRATERPEGRA